MLPAETPRHLLLVSIGALAASAFFLTRPLVHSPTSISQSSQSSQSSPDGYQRMQVLSATPIGNEYAVRVGDSDKAITMYVGSSEGMAISLHLQGEKYVRPLSMELMDATLRELGATLDRVQVDTIVDHAYIGSIHLRGHAPIDARPSDAVALAMIHGAPIYIADSVIAIAGN
jgi:bifunctional DNase/RNase